MPHLPLEYATAIAPASRRFRWIYKYSFALAAVMILFLNVVSGEYRGPLLGTGFVTEFGWPLVHHREVFHGSYLVVDNHHERFAADAIIVLLLTMIFALASRWYLRHLELGKSTKLALAVPIAQGTFILFLVLVCLAHVRFKLGN